MLQKGFQVTNYIDDIIGIATKSQTEDSFNAFTNLLAELGLDISQKKLICPTTKAFCLGVLNDTEDLTISVPDDKLKILGKLATNMPIKLTGLRGIYNHY